MKTAAEKRQLQQEATFQLERMLPAGSTVYTSIKSVSRSGMSRDIAVYCVRDGRIHNITFWVACLLGWRLIEGNGGRAVRVEGLGMDMGYHLVESVSIALYGLEGRNLLRPEWL